MNKKAIVPEFKPFRWKGPRRKFHCNICGKDGIKTAAAAKAHVTRTHEWGWDKKPETVTDARLQESKETFHQEMDQLRREKPKSEWTDSMWLAELDSLMLRSDIVPTCNSEYPAGMDRAECLEHLIRLVKRGESPAPTDPGKGGVNCAPPPWWIRLVDDFQSACETRKMLSAEDELPSGVSQDSWNTVIDRQFEPKRRRLLLILEMLVKRSEVADRLEQELVNQIQ